MRQYEPAPLDHGPRYWRCGRKKAHRTRKKARTARSYMEAVYGLPFSIYKCEFCDKWHVGRKRRG